MKFLHEKPLHYDVKKDVGNQLDTIQTYVDELKEQLQLVQNDPLISANDSRIFEARDQLNFFLQREKRYEQLLNPDNIGGYFYVPAEASREELKNVVKTLQGLSFQQNPALSNIIECLTTKIELPLENARKMEITLPLLQSEAWLVQSLLEPNNTSFHDIENYLHNYEHLILPMKNIDRTQLSEKEDNLIQALIRNFQGGFLQSCNAAPNTSPSEAAFHQSVKQSIDEILKHHNIQKAEDISDFTANNPSRQASIIETVKQILTKIFEHFFPSILTKKDTPEKDSFKILKETYQTLKQQENKQNTETNNDENKPTNPRPQ